MIGNSIAGFLGTGVAASTNSYESIATVTVGTATSSITFSSIPSTYTHLQIRGIGNNGTATTEAIIQLNGDTGNNYSWHTLQGTGTSAIAAAGTTTNGMKAIQTSSPTFGAAIIDLLDYKSTAKYKTVRTLNGFDANGSGNIFLWSGLWMNTAAITSITISYASAQFQQYSSFALYGVK